MKSTIENDAVLYGLIVNLQQEIAKLFPNIDIDERNYQLCGFNLVRIANAYDEMSFGDYKSHLMDLADMAWICGTASKFSSCTFLPSISEMKRILGYVAGLEFGNVDGYLEEI